MFTFHCCNNDISFGPFILTTSALIFSIVSSQCCTYLHRTYVSTDYNFSFFVPTKDGQSFGIWSYEMEGSCLPYPSNMAVDTKFISGMAFAALKSVIGVANLIILLLVSIRGCNIVVWSILCCSLFLNCLLESLMLLLKSSMLCNPSYGICSLDTGAKLGITAIVLWFLAGISVANLAPPVGCCCSSSSLQDHVPKRLDSRRRSLIEDCFNRLLCCTVPFGVPFD
jgi:hypothetical protein